MDLTIGLTNEGDDVTLDYDIEVDVEVGYPAGVVPNITASSAEGSIAPGSSETITISAGAAETGVFYGTFRIETNIDNTLVFDIPFRLSVGGATAPKLAVSEEDAGDLGDFSGEMTQTEALFTVSNEGSLPLDFQATTTLVTRANPFPFDTTPDAGRGTGGEVLFSEDFSDGDLGEFIAGGSFPGDWQVVDIGPATDAGHSQPNTSYFGQVLDGTLQYRNLATGILISPALDLSDVPQEDLVVLEFNTYLQAEVGFDFASVLISFDDGDSYQEVATSDNGILQNTTEWETVTIELPLFASYPDPVRFAFQFVTDQLVTDIGWFIDDVTLTTQPGANPVFVSPVASTLGDGESQELTLTIQGDQLERGYYRGEVLLISNSLEFSEAGVPVGFTDQGVRIIEASRSVPFNLTVGDPSRPLLEVLSVPTLVSVPADDEATGDVEVSNTGGASLTYLRVMEPALSSFLDPMARPFAFDGSSKLDDAALASFKAGRSVVAGGDSLFSIVLPGASSNISGITQLPDGRVVVADAVNGGRTYVLSEDLGAVEATLDGFFEGSEAVTGVAYDDETETLWYATSQGRFVEATLGAAAVEPTGSSFDTDFVPAGIAYSPELDAFFTPERNATVVYAVDATGAVLPGYPVEALSRGGLAPGLSMTDGVMELFNENLSYVQLDQFGRLYEESQEIVVPGALVGGSARINGLLRSKTNPDGVIYYLARPAGGVVRVIGVDPIDLPDYTRTIIEAEEPLYGFELEPGASETLTLRIDPNGRAPGMYTETLAFLTNNTEDRIVRIPIEVEVTPATATEDGASIPAVFAVHQNYPNPFVDQTMLRFDLPVAARATLTVYNVLGQRVALLLDDEVLEAGAHTVDFDARSLASGTYVARLVADNFTGSQRLTVVK